MFKKTITEPGVTTASLEQFGKPGHIARVTVVPTYALDSEEASLGRRTDTKIRSFHVRGRLARSHSAVKKIEVNFDKESGGSYFIAPDGTHEYRIEVHDGTVCVAELNNNREIAAISLRCQVQSSAEARATFYRVARPWLDYVCYLADVPYYIDQISIVDEAHHIQDVEVFHPEVPKIVSAGAVRVFEPLIPYYAMYREAKNSSSILYKFLCYFKILEGIISTLQPKLKARAKKLGIGSDGLIHLVPGPTPLDMYDEKQQGYVGKSIHSFVQGYLTKRYRDAVAHFTLKDGTSLNVSDFVQLDRYAGILPILENCCRVAIANIEAFIAASPEMLPLE